MWRAKWSHVVIALGVIAALAIASPVFGLSKSIKAAIKKEVSKQIGKSTGPTGAKGADGTARAYAVVYHACSGGLPEVCGFDHAKGVAGVTRPFGGDYCVDVPGISAESVPAAVTVEWNGTNGPEGNASAMTDANDHDDCPTVDQFEVLTERHSDSGGTDAVPADDIGFTIVIP